eukprot:365925-Chlamydomonas_euryale.AAC.15
MYQNWVWSMSTYPYYEAAEVGDASLELLEQLTGLPRDSMLKISYIDTLVGRHAAHAQQNFCQCAGELVSVSDLGTGQAPHIWGAAISTP